MVTYRRWSFMLGSNWKALTGKVLVFWIGGRLWEVVAHGVSTGLTQLLMNYVICSQNICSFHGNHGWGSVSQYVKRMGGHFYIKGQDELGVWFANLLLSFFKINGPPSQVINNQPLKLLFVLTLPDYTKIHLFCFKLHLAAF